MVCEAIVVGQVRGADHGGRLSVDQGFSSHMRYYAIRKSLALFEGEPLEHVDPGLRENGSGVLRGSLTMPISAGEPLGKTESVGTAEYLHEGGIGETRFLEGVHRGYTQSERNALETAPSGGILGP